MAKHRRATRHSADTPKEAVPAAISENDLNDALTNALENNGEEDGEDGEEDYRPDVEQDAKDEDVSLNNEDEDEDEEEEADGDEDEDEDEETKPGKAEDGENEDEDEDNDEDNDDDAANSDGNTSGTSLKRKLAAAARRHKHSNLNAVNRKRQQLASVGADGDQEDNASPVVNDEFVTADDPKGDTKITELGVLKGGREFRVKTFRVPGRGDRMYAISTDVARLVGYRDSYFLFQKHTNLYRVRIDEDSKMALISSEFLPVTFKTRAAYLITARSAFKEFGARIILDGRQVIDDYYEDKAKEEGAIEGALINPVLSNDGYTNSVTDNQTLFERQRNIALLLSNNNILETETSWVYDHALKCRQFDSMLFYDRNELLKKQVQRDIYTNLNFVPNITQPTRCKMSQLKPENNETKRKIIFDTVIGGSSVVATGLSDVPLDVFDCSVSEDVKKAILEQQQLEKSL